MPTRTRRSRQHPRWHAWQSSAVTRGFLGPEDRAKGWTVLKVAPPSRDAFLDMVGVLALYGQLAPRYPTHPGLRLVWKLWHAWTRQLAGYLRREQPGTMPMPAELLMELVRKEQPRHEC